VAQDDAKRFPIGRTALGGASCGFTYDGAMQDAVARESGLRRPLRLTRWQGATRSTVFASAAHEGAEQERPVSSA
jgi:hypothetical protein